MIGNQERMYLNIVKGISVLLMMWGHCIQYCAKESFSVFENSAFQFIYSFHMPLFMLLSGYLFFFSYQKRDLKNLLIHRTQGMLQPIVFGSMLNTILMMIPTWILHGEGRITNGVLFNSLFTLWFLWCVLSASIAVAIAGKTVCNFWLRLLLMFLGIFLVALFPENHFHVYMYPYFVAGFYYGMYREKIPSWLSRFSWISLAIFPWMLGGFEDWHLIYVSPVYYPGMDLMTMVKLNSFRWIIGYAGSLCVLLLTNVVVKWYWKRERFPVILVLLAKMGENSLAIYCLSVSLLSYYLSKIYDRFLLMTGVNIFAENMVIYNYVFTPLLTLLFAAGLYAVVQLMKKWRIHQLIFGR